MHKDIKVTFPHMGNYYIPIVILLRNILKCEIIIPPPITKKTLELGSKYSPDFVCVPFKYNLGNYIEGLEKGANILIQIGGGCRFGYYGEVQENILKDLGYNFKFISLSNYNGLDLNAIYSSFKELNPNLSFKKFIYYFTLIVKVINKLDIIEEYIRRNIGFEINKGSFEKLEKDFLNNFKKINTFKELYSTYYKYIKLFKKIPLKKDKDRIKIGIIGELYTSMEPFSTYFMERELAKKNIEIDRHTTVTYLLFKKSKMKNKLLKMAGKYLKYPIGADGTESVALSKKFAEKGYDGIIHSKPFGCTPEVNAIPILQKISNDYKIPIIYFSFDSQNSETGIKTRLEAFYDMLIMRKEKING